MVKNTCLKLKKCIQFTIIHPKHEQRAQNVRVLYNRPMTNYVTHTIEPWMPLGALKAKQDIIDIALTQHWQVLPLARYNDSRDTISQRQNNINLWCDALRENDTVVHQFPTYMSAAFEQQFIATLNQRRVHSVVLIHDIEPLRLTKQQPWEFDLLNAYDLVVVHSQAMADILAHNGVVSDMIIHAFFDYLAPTPSIATYSHQINFAGTFQKSPWLQTYNGQLPITLFGAKPRKWQHIDWPEHVHFQGNLDPIAIVAAFQSGFGLLWDSDFEGKTYQTYTRYNAPHKASLYLHAGLPLIAWSQSAIGQIIQKHHLGITVDNLSQLDQVATISKDDYYDFQKHMSPFQLRLQNGDYTKNTLQKINATFSIDEL